MQGKGVCKISQSTFRPNYSFHPQDCLFINKGDSIAVSLEKITVDEEGIEWATGFNQKTGKSGQLPLFIFEGPTIALDLGTSNFSLGYFSDYSTSQFQSVLIEGNEYRNCRIAFSSARSNNQDDQGNYNCKASAKGLLKWLDIPRFLNGDDPFFLLQGCKLVNASAPPPQTTVSSTIFECKETGMRCTLSDLIDMFMRDIRDWLKSSHFKSNSRLIISLPFSTKYYAKMLLRQGALMAGFVKVDFVSQCTGLCLYHLHSNRFNGNTDMTGGAVPATSDINTGLCLSIGAGYSDVCIFQTGGAGNDKTVRIGSTIGECIGGLDLTKSIFEAAKSKRKRALSSETGRSSQDKDLFLECEMVKVNLGSLTADHFEIPDGENGYILMKREEILTAMAPVLGRIEKMIQRCVEAQNIEHLDIDSIISYGPSSTFFEEWLSTFFPKSTIQKLPPNATLQGACLRTTSSFAFTRLKSLEGPRSYHYGIETANGFSPVLHSNEPFPQSIPLGFEVSKPSFICIYEGNYVSNAFNTLLFHLQIDSLPFMESSTVFIELNFDKNGLLIAKIADEQGSIIHQVLLNNPTFIENQVYIKFSPGQNIKKLNHDFSSLKNSLSFAPNRPNDNDSVGCYFNYVNELYPLLDNLRRSTIPINLLDFISRKLIVQHYVLRYWMEIVQFRDSPSKSIDNKRLETFFFDIKGLTSDLLATIQSPLQVHGSAIVHASNTRWFEVQKQLNVKLLALDDLDDLNEISMKNLKKTLVKTCQANLKFSESVEALVTTATATSAGSFPESSSINNFQVVLQSILSLMIQCSFSGFPKHLLEGSMIRQIQAIHTAASKWKSVIPPLQLAPEVRGLLPAEKSSYYKLVKLNEEICSYCVQNHPIVISTPLIVTNSTILPQENKSWFIYEEAILKVLIQLDNVNIHGGQRLLRSTRKAVVNYCQLHLNSLDAIKILAKS